MKMRLLFFSMFFFSYSADLLAGGFQLNMQGGKATGMGGAFCSLAWDASSVFYNPGGMVRISGHQFTIGGFLIIPRVSLQTQAYDNINQTSRNSTPIHFYYAGKIYKNLWGGMAINNQFGSSASFDPAWQGRYIVQKIGLKTFMFQPTLAYRIHEKVSIGLGLVYAVGNFEYMKAVPVSTQSVDYGQVTLTGKGSGIGVNVGIHAIPFEKEIQGGKIRVGIGGSYRSGIRLDLTTAKAVFTDIPTSLQTTFPGEQSFQASLTLPAVTTGGISVRYGTEEHFTYTLIFDYQYNQWSSYDTLRFDFEHPETPDAETPKNWKDVSTLRWGLDITYKAKYSVRMGIYRDHTPVPDGRVSPELPDNTHTGYTAGVGVVLNQMVSLDLAYLYSFVERLNASLDTEGFLASYRRKVSVVGVSINISLGNNKKTAVQ